MKARRNGILAAGNFIVDYVKIIENYPEQDMLATILSESKSNGGGPYNVLCDLSAMEVAYPLFACGLIGDDVNGQWISDDLSIRGIDTTQLHRDRGGSTSFTDAMTVSHSGRRTFFHHRGSNARFDLEHCDPSCCDAKIFHLAYLMLLDQLDGIRENGRTGASILLENASHAGMITCVDMVSTEHPKFHDIALSALPWTDYLIINEIEAGHTLGKKLAADQFSALQEAAQSILDAGVRNAVIIHTPHVAVAASRNEPPLIQPALKLPPNFIKGATGAGDAFASGLLHGIHEGLCMQDCLHLATCTAAVSLTDPTPSAGLRPVATCLDLGNRFAYNNQGTCLHEDD